MLENGKGLMFLPGEQWRREIKMKTHALNQKYNALTEYEPEKRKEILREILGELNENVTLQGPVTFHCGRYTKIGKNTFINFNFTCQDDTELKTDYSQAEYNQDLEEELVEKTIKHIE